LSDCALALRGRPVQDFGVVTDVVVILDKFKNLVGAPLKARADLEPSLPDLEINITDAVYAIEAFTGEEYPFGPVGDPCGG
jgi:hypothetical protein